MRIPFFLLLLLLPGMRSDKSLDEAIRLYEKGEFQQAVNLLQQLKSTSPDEAEIRLWLGKSHLKVLQWDDAVREMEKAVELRPSSAQYHLWFGRALGARASHSIFFTAIRWARRVVREFEKGRDLDPKDLDVRFDLLEFYLQAPGIVGGGKDKAEAEAKVIAKLDPRMGYTARATIHEKNEKWDLARKELIQATVDFPEHADAFKDLATFLFGRKDFEGAKLYANKTLALNGKSKQARLTAVAAEIRLNADLDLAEGTLRELAAGPLGENDPSFEEVNYWLGECYLAKGNKAEARRAFESALRFNAEHSEAKKRLSELK